MIKKITLENFKAFKHAEIEIKPLTILVGPNNGGKTSLLHSILLIKQTLESNEPDILKLKGNVNFGDFENVIHQDSSLKEIKLRFEFEEDNKFLDITFSKEDGIAIVKDFSCNTGELEYSIKNIKMVRHEGLMLCFPEDYSFKSTYTNLDEDLLETIKPVFYGNNFFITPEIPTKNFDGITRYLNDLEKDMHRNPSLYWRKDSKTKKLTFQDKLRSIQVFLSLIKYTNKFNTNVRQEFDNILYLGPIRNVANRLYERGHYEDVGFKGENVAPIIAEKSYMQGKVTQTLEKLGIAKAVEILEKDDRYFELKLKTDITDSSVNFADVGCGTSQILPIIVQLLIPRKNTMLIFEQPETHLHPKIQAELASLLVGLLKDKTGFLPDEPIDPDSLSAEDLKNKTKYLIETHSDYLIERIRYHITKGDLKPEDVIIYYIDPDPITKYSRTIKIEISSEGEYSNLPKGYLTNFRMEEINRQLDLTYEKMINKLE